jgi:hypothetical protein
MSLDRETIAEAYAELAAAEAKVAALSYDALTGQELLGLLEQLEIDRRRQSAVEHRLLARLAAEATRDGGRANTA